MTIDKIEYTYYGDLLGIGNYYQLNPLIAKDKLNQFYNISYDKLAPLRTNDPTSSIILFSDSILITGENHWDALKIINNLYSVLLFQNLLLRGAMVKGKLIFQQRNTVENFEKKLPIDDTLAKAVGLEKMFNGSRFIIENRLVEDLFSDCRNWLTHEGYSRNRNKCPKNADILSRISPTPDNTHYEMLSNLPADYDDETVIKKIKEDLKYVIKMSSPEVKIHYNETLELIKRSESRYYLSESE